MTETPQLPPDSVTVSSLQAERIPESRLLQSEDLFSGRREILIAHGQELYRLRLTRSNKLILHK